MPHAFRDGSRWFGALLRSSPHWWAVRSAGKVVRPSRSILTSTPGFTTRRLGGRTPLQTDLAVSGRNPRKLDVLLALQAAFAAWGWLDGGGNSSPDTERTRPR